MKRCHQNLSGILAATYLLLIILVVLCSWVGSAVGVNMRSLFSADGLRWAFSHFVPNLADAPWAQLLIGITTLSIIIQSGILHSISRQATLKQKRALSLAILVFVVECIVMLSLLLPPAGVLLSPLGTIANSPLEYGWYGMLCVGLIIICNVFGLSSGRFVSMADIIEAHIALLHRLMPSVPPLIILSQLIAILDYTRLMPADSSAAAVVTPLLYIATVVACISRTGRQ